MGALTGAEVSSGPRTALRGGWPGVGAWVAAALIWGIGLLKITVPLLPGLALAGFLFCGGLALRGRLDRLGLLVLANFTYWFLSAAVVGALVPLDLASVAFYDGDGRIFLYYLPLLLFCVYDGARRRDLIFTLHAVRGMALFCLGLFAVWLLTGSPLLATANANDFIGFLTSHTAAGSFFGLLSLFLIIVGIESRSRASLVLGLLMIFPVLLSASRQALVAMALAAFWYVLRERRFRLASGIAIAATLLLLATPIVAPRTFQRTASLFSWDVVESVIEIAQTTDWQEGMPKHDEVEAEGTVNALNRILFWSYATRRFADSPLVGIGFGRYNDHDLSLYGNEGTVALAVDGERVVAVANAHNSYLHVLAESGLIGLSMLLFVWILLYRRLGRTMERMEEDRQVRAYLYGCQLLIVFALVSAMFGHALAAPALGLPILAIVGVALSYDRWPGSQETSLAAWTGEAR